MPTFDKLARFLRDYSKLTRAEKVLFRQAIAEFVEDLRRGDGRFRPGLRVKGVRGRKGAFEMSWAADGRATFHYGESLGKGDPHIVWRRVGTHSILSDP